MVLALGTQENLPGSCIPRVGQYIVRYTSDGSSWSSGTVDATAFSGDMNTYSFGIINNNGLPDGLWVTELQQCGNGSFGDRLKRHLRWNESTHNFDEEVEYSRTYPGPVTTGDAWVWTDGFYPHPLYWRDNDEYRIPPWANSWTASPSPSGPGTTPSFGFEDLDDYLDVGSDTDGGFDYMHLFESGGTPDWDAGEQVLDTTDGYIEKYFRFTSTGNTYVIIQDVNIPRIYGRSDPLVPPAAPGNRLWIYNSTDGGQNWASRGLVT
jgi:hypothetical protein